MHPCFCRTCALCGHGCACVCAHVCMQLLGYMRTYRHMYWGVARESEAHDMFIGMCIGCICTHAFEKHVLCVGTTAHVLHTCQSPSLCTCMYAQSCAHFRAHCLFTFTAPTWIHCMFFPLVCMMQQVLTGDVQASSEQPAHW